MSFFGINLASRSLLAQQQALAVTGQNIANVDVPGYSRQEAVLTSVSGPGAEGLYGAGNPLAAGGGVDVALVQRSHAAWLDQTAAQLQAQVGESASGDRTASSLEGLLAEPTDAGLSATIDRFFTAFGNLGTQPNDAAARDNVVRAGKDLAERFTQLTNGIESLRQDVIGQARDNVTTVNNLARQVAALSHQISQAQAAGAHPNELLDQRDQLLQQIVQRTGATVSGQQGNSVVVSLGGTTLVQGDHVNSLDVASGSPLSLVVGGSSQPITPSSGELASELQWANTLLPDYQSRLGGIRDRLSAAVNSLHVSGKDGTGAPGQPFFVAGPGGDITVNPGLAADGRKVVAGDGSAGDQRVATAIANIGTAAGSPVPQYRQWVADIGSQAAGRSSKAGQMRASLQQIQAAQASESGVNLDEELAQMVSQQQAYTASARLISTYDLMLSTLIQSTGA
jgi:flagellar hook-associated protein 1 FlgK